VPDFFEAETGELARGVRRSIERRVVADDEFSVAGGVNVKLDAGGSVLESSPHRVERAGRGLLGASLVGVGDHPPFEPGIVTHFRCLPAECACRATTGG